MARFPDDLVQAQYDWMRTYEALACARHIRHTALRRRLLRLSNRIARHPFWPEQRGPGAGLPELRRQARRGR
ncbi:hypothetical protein [Streptomyces sp. NPDC050560]|uniref:hypothetical protein n=1 Tax=Streptomyces sp. NPDC050560 TaxID=3365630 RepID=UPI003797494A